MGKNSIEEEYIYVTPPPGSMRAQKLGCCCPVLDNSFGRGYMGMPGVYVYSEDCPIHSEDVKKAVDKEKNT